MSDVKPFERIVTTDLATIASTLAVKTGRVNLRACLRAFRDQAVAIAMAAGERPNETRAARILGVGRSTLRRWRGLDEGTDATA